MDATTGYDPCGLWVNRQFRRPIGRPEYRQFRHPVRHVRNPNTGHTISFPYQPTTVIRRPHAVSGLFMVYGGTPPGNARAAERSWQEALAFLAQATGRA